MAARLDLVRTENFILIEGASESPSIRGDACAGLDDTSCICPAVCTEKLILIEGVSESPRFEGDAGGDLDRTGCLGSAVQVEGPA